mmetsp:Transcript_43961/g.125332  ORF Transcript_43961/g.125332 Transcript_43961/m.125332 type:complete len:483 (-) Transcript_43961:1033-2481(-)
MARKHHTLHREEELLARNVELPRARGVRAIELLQLRLEVLTAKAVQELLLQGQRLLQGEAGRILPRRCNRSVACRAGSGLRRGLQVLHPHDEEAPPAAQRAAVREGREGSGVSRLADQSALRQDLRPPQLLCHGIPDIPKCGCCGDRDLNLILLYAMLDLDSHVGDRGLDLGFLVWGRPLWQIDSQQLVEDATIPIELFIIAEGPEGFHHLEDACHVAGETILRQHFALDSEKKLLPFSRERSSAASMHGFKFEQLLLEVPIGKSLVQVLLQAQCLLFGECWLSDLVFLSCSRRTHVVNPNEQEASPGAELIAVWERRESPSRAPHQACLLHYLGPPEVTGQCLLHVPHRCCAGHDHFHSIARRHSMLDSDLNVRSCLCGHVLGRFDVLILLLLRILLLVFSVGSLMLRGSVVKLEQLIQDDCILQELLIGEAGQYPHHVQHSLGVSSESIPGKHLSLLLQSKSLALEPELPGLPPMLLLQL